MTIQEAKNKLKKYGTVNHCGVEITETKKMIGNWQNYTGRYVVVVQGEKINDESVSLTKAFQIAKPYFQ
jgi:hypothetical protein